ncbi:MAG: terminase small subunit [Burkholderiales bacterium]|nr:terminase small subunit [Burkholderiales bacterium]
MHLTPKQSRFVDEYALDRNGAGAAVRAGYAAGSAHVTASRLLRNTNVGAALRQRELDYAIALNVDRDKVMDGLKDGIALATEQQNPNAVIAGWREIGKLCGYSPIGDPHSASSRARLGP